MPATHTSTFTIRFSECDAYEHLNNANYLRLMQEAAFEASAAVGYPKERYETMGYLWLAHESQIEYLQPLRYGDQIEVTTWVADFRQIRSIRQYEFRKVGSAELAARAYTDWVYLERSSSRPARIPPEMVAAFASDDPVTGLPRQPFPAPPPAPPGAFRQQRRVEWRDIDSAQHLNNAAYLNYVEDCSIQATRHYGWPMERVREAGLAIIARRHHIIYKQPALLDDEIEVTTWGFDVRRFSATRHFDLHRLTDGALLAQVQTHWVWVDLVTGRPTRIPQSFLDDLWPNVAGGK